MNSPKMMRFLACGGSILRPHPKIEFLMQYESKKPGARSNGLGVHNEYLACFCQVSTGIEITDRPHTPTSRRSNMKNRSERVGIFCTNRTKITCQRYDFIQAFFFPPWFLFSILPPPPCLGSRKRGAWLSERGAWLKKRRVWRFRESVGNPPLVFERYLLRSPNQSGRFRPKSDPPHRITRGVYGQPWRLLAVWSWDLPAETLFPAARCERVFKCTTESVHNIGTLAASAFRSVGDPPYSTRRRIFTRGQNMA